MAGLALGLWGVGCASKIPQTLGSLPPGKASDFKPEGILFWTIGADEDQRKQFSLQEAMDLEGADHLLLLFGSKACAACGRKAEVFKNQVLGKHPLFLTDEGKRFKVIGVNTDPSPERLGSYFNQYPFIRWSDPSGRTMVQHFLVGEEKFKVPLSVLVGRQGILWRIGADDPVSVGEMMEKVGLSLRGDGQNPGNRPELPGEFPGELPDPVKEGPTGPSPESPTSPKSSLAMIAANRLEGVGVEDCLGNQRSLQSLREAGKNLVVQVVRHSCQGECLANQLKIESLCQKTEPPQCQSLTLVATQEAVAGFDYGPNPPGSGVCQAPGVVKGGGDFFEVFPSLFDWDYPRSLDPQGYVLIDRPERGPQVYMFAPDGQLRYAKEGHLQTQVQDLAKILEASQVALPATRDTNLPGPDFQLYRGLESVGFASLRREHAWTALAFFQTDCGSCEQELKHWSAPGGLLDFCQERAGFCGIYAVENRYSPEGWSLDEFYNKLINGYQLGRFDGYLGFKAMGIRVPLLLDPIPDDTSDDSYKNRIHDGYLLALSPNLGNGYRIVVYDQDGKIAKLMESKEALEGPSGGRKKDELELFLEEQWKLSKEAERGP